MNNKKNVIRCPAGGPNGPISLCDGVRWGGPNGPTPKKKNRTKIMEGPNGPILTTLPMMGGPNGPTRIQRIKEDRMGLPKGPPRGKTPI